MYGAGPLESGPEVKVEVPPTTVELAGVGVICGPAVTVIVTVPCRGAWLELRDADEEAGEVEFDAVTGEPDVDPVDPPVPVGEVCRLSVLVKVKKDVLVRFLVEGKYPVEHGMDELLPAVTGEFGVELGGAVELPEGDPDTLLKVTV